MEVDDDVNQLALQGKTVRAIQLLRERTGVDFNQAHTAVNALLPSAHRMRAAGGGGVSVLLICAVIVCRGGGHDRGGGGGDRPV
jgi:hypothetical protein